MADFISDFGRALGDKVLPNGDILNRKIDFQREKFLKGVSTTKHGKKEDPTYLYFKFIFDFGISNAIDPQTFLAPSPLFRSYDKTDYDALAKYLEQRSIDAFQAGADPDILRIIQNEVSNKANNGFYTDTDFFYGAKAKIQDRANSGFYPVNNNVAYMGAQEFLFQRSQKRQQMLEAFKKGIDFINKECPYYFQSLSGLNTLLRTDIENYHKKASAPKRAGTLTIDCLESIDMRMFSLSELYRKSIYDYTNHRVMLPQNLRKFRMWLVVTEIRNIQLSYGINDVLNPFSIPGVAQAANFLDSFNTQTGLLDNTQGLLQKSTNEAFPGTNKFGTYSMGPYAFVYQFDQCEFDFDDTYPSYSQIDSKGGQAVSSQFKIHVGRVKDYKIQFNQLADVLRKDNNIQQMVISDVWGSSSSPYNLFDNVGTEGIENVTFSDKGNPAEYFASLASNFITNTVSDLKNQGVSIVQGELLGNIYGFGGFNLGQATNSVQGLVSTIDGGVPNPFRNTNPQTQGLGGPGERQYPTVNTDVYPGVPENPAQTLGNVISNVPGNPSLQSDVYPSVPGQELGLPDRQYPTTTTDEFGNTPGTDLGVPDRVYPDPNTDQYANVPGPDLGLPDRQYPANNDDQYADVPGADLGVPSRVYPDPNSDQYADVPGQDLGLPSRQYPTVTDDMYNDVPGQDLGVPSRVYTAPGGDQYPDAPGIDLGLPDRQYPQTTADEYSDVPGQDLGPGARVYPPPAQPSDQYLNVPGEDLGLPSRQYPSYNGPDEYPGAPGADLGPDGRVYPPPTPPEDRYTTVPGEDLGLPSRQYPYLDPSDEYPNAPGADLGPQSRVYPPPTPPEDKYLNTPGSDLGLPIRQYPIPEYKDEYTDVPGKDLGPSSRVYTQPEGKKDVYENVPGIDQGLPSRSYPVVPSQYAEEYPGVPGNDLGPALGPQTRVYKEPSPREDVYSEAPGDSLGLPSREYPKPPLKDEYERVPGEDLGSNFPGTRSRVYEQPREDVYPNKSPLDTREYPQVPPPYREEYEHVPGRDLGPSKDVESRVYPVPRPEEPKGVPGQEGRAYPPVNPDYGDEYGNVPGKELGPDYSNKGRVYPKPEGNIYENTLGGQREYPGINPSRDGYENVPGKNLGAPERIYQKPTEDVYTNSSLGNEYSLLTPKDEYPNSPGKDLGPTDRIYPKPYPNPDVYVENPIETGRVYPTVSTNDDVYPNVPGQDLGGTSRVYQEVNWDSYRNTPGEDLGLPQRLYPRAVQRAYPEGEQTPQINLGRTYPRQED